jgi:hypothetical protein
MERDQIICELEAERDRLTQAINALTGINAPSKLRRGRSSLSAAEKKHISNKMKQYWAAKKRKAQKPITAKSSVSAAIRAYVAQHKDGVALSSITESLASKTKKSRAKLADLVYRQVSKGHLIKKDNGVYVARVM